MNLFRSLAMMFLFYASHLSAQNNETAEKNFDRADKIFSAAYEGDKKESLLSSKGKYADVLPVFLDLYKLYPDNMNLAFKIGVCYMGAVSDRAKAVLYFTKAVTNVSDNCKESSFTEKRAPVIAWKLLGDACHLSYQFDKAMDAYGNYIKVMADNNRSDKVQVAEVNRQIDMCKTGKQLFDNPVKIKIQSLGASVNSPYADYSPVLSADQNTLFFTSRRSSSMGGEKDEEGNYMEDIYSSERTKTGWSTATNIGPRINTIGHEASVGLSADGQTIFIYKDDAGDGNIYSTSLEGDVWSTPVKLNENIDSKYWEPSACISADGSTLYFTSDRPGGYGGRDLYTSKLSPEGDWSVAVNMGPNINTKYEEDAPFMHPDGVTLSFSSNGHNTMGGFDIFTSVLSDDGTWAEPMNAGYPVNTTDDDIFYVVSPDGLKAYFSSFRSGGFGEKDNYMATFLDKKKVALTLMKGIVNDESGKPGKKVLITVTDNETGKIVGVYHTNSKTGKFLFILTPGKNYNITYNSADHLFYSENMEIPKNSDYYELNKAVSLKPIVVGAKITLNNIFFDFDKSTLRTLSNVEINNLVMLMKSNPNLKVEISGYTDSKGDVQYNQKLSEDRAAAVMNSLVTNGIDAGRMKAKGYGKTKPVAPNTKANGSDNPNGRQLNRRVEFVVTEIN